jgi:glycosyltransferase involved in cell wall biosynthesis
MNIVSLISTAASPCGVEAFARQLAARLHENRDGRHASLCVSGRWREIAELRKELRHADLVIMNLHLAAWKNVILHPLLAIVLARLHSSEVLVILHEWGDLDWKRRWLLALYMPFATRLLLSAPRVERQFRAAMISLLTTRRRGIVPIPANVERPASSQKTELAVRIAYKRRAGCCTIGQFGSIYPKKQNTIVLEVAAELRRRGTKVFLVFVGDFLRGRDHVEEEFMARVHALELEQSVLITGYLQSNTEVFAALNEIDVFVYFFAEGLTSNRSSVLTCLQAGKTVVVNAPLSPQEFDHHCTYREQLAGDRLQLVATDASIADLTAQVEKAISSVPVGPLVDFARSWNDVLEVVAHA